MSLIRTAVPLIVLTSVLTGCAGLQKTDWPTCAAVGGVGGAALGAIQSSAWAGGGAVFGAGMAAAYCWYMAMAMRTQTVYLIAAINARIRQEGRGLMRQVARSLKWWSFRKWW